jgi:hypothetical protein
VFSCSRERFIRLAVQAVVEVLSGAHERKEKAKCYEGKVYFGRFKKKEVLKS